MFSKPTPAELYQAFINDSELGEAFEKGELSAVLICNKEKKTVTPRPPREVLRQAKALEDAGIDNPYQIAIYYGLYLNAIERQGTATLDMEKIAEIKQLIIDLLRSNEALKALTHQGEKIIDSLRATTFAAKLQTRHVYYASDVLPSNDRIDNSKHGSRFAAIIDEQDQTRPIVQKEKVGKALACFEVAANELYRLIVGNHLPAAKRIKTRNDSDGVASILLTDFIPAYKKEGQEHFIKTRFKGLAKIGITALFLQENDLHAGNCGICRDEKGEWQIVKIDGDHAFFGKFTGELHGYTEARAKEFCLEGDWYRSNDYHATDFFGIHHIQLEFFPHILRPILPLLEDPGSANINQDEQQHKPLNKDTGFLPANWIGYGIKNAEAFTGSMWAISADPDFIEEKFFTILKIAILPTALLRIIVDSTLPKPTERTALLDFLQQRRVELFSEALLVPGFKAFLTTQGIKAKEQIQQEIHEFLALPENEDYLMSNNPQVSCYDEAIAVNFQTRIEAAELDYQALQAQDNAQLEEKRKQIQLQTEQGQLQIQENARLEEEKHKQIQLQAEQQPLQTLYQGLKTKLGKQEQVKYFKNTVNGFKLNLLLRLADDMQRVQANKAKPEVMLAFAEIRRERYGIYRLTSNWGNTRRWKEVTDAVKTAILVRMLRDNAAQPTIQNKIELDKRLYQQIESIMHWENGRANAKNPLLARFQSEFTYSGLVINTDSTAELSETHTVTSLAWINLRK